MIPFSKIHLLYAFILPHVILGFAPITSTVVHKNQSSSILLSTAISKADESSDAVIVGAGPAGLLSAIMYAQKYPDQKVQVFDRLNPPPSPTDSNIWSDVAKFYLIGLSARGQSALAKYGVWNEVKDVCTEVVGRKDWSPESKSEDGVERIFTDRPVSTQVLPRDKLVGVLHKHVLDNYQGRIQLNYGYDIFPEDFAVNENKGVRVRVSKCTSSNRQNPSSAVSANDTEQVECNIDESFTLDTKLLIAADGTTRTIANEMERKDKERWQSLNALQKVFAEKPFHVRRYIDDNRRVYKTVPMKIPSDWRPDLNYSARTADGRVNYDALPADRNGNYCGVLLVRDGDEFAAANADPIKFRALLDDVLPQFSKLLDDKTVAEIAKKPPSFLPSFRYAGPRLNQGDYTIILGDSAHTVKPYFGLGANSALEDVTILDDTLETTTSIPDAVHLFTKKRAKDSESLVKISRELDRPGKLGFFSFILPLILDGIFHGMLPKVFAPNVINCLQKPSMSFTSVRRRKRLDRIGQLVLVGGFFSGLTSAAKWLVKSVAKGIGVKNETVTMAMVGLAVLASVAKKSASIFDTRQSPADVITKTKK
jgi:kynurenine 3-monooxygenase